MLNSNGRGALLSGLFLSFVVGLTIVLIGGANAASPCANSLAIPNASVTASADGTTLRGSACADRIVVTSPQVKDVVGGGGNDVIFANPNVEVVDGGEGDDTLYGNLPEAEGASAAPAYVPARSARESGMATASITEKECKAGVSCYGGDGSQELIGSSGNDKIFGQRGNDILKGNVGNDQLFGGVGDESLISGGSGNDLLSGGLGTDYLNGNQDSDLVRGDGTIDTIEDTGESGGADTLSFATAVTPGFHGTISLSGFPADADNEERGVYLRLDGVEGLCGKDQDGNPMEACNNDARYGGGSDHLGINVTNGKGFENIIGSPFADHIVGSGAANRIDGGGGADVIYGKAGNDEIYGGADGDYISGEEGTDTVYGQAGVDNCVAETANECSGTAESVVQRERNKISVGFMVTSAPASLSWVGLYLTGSTGTDRVKITYAAGSVTFSAEAESAQFDTGANAAAGCSYEATKVTCSLSKSLDAITVAGIGGNDTLTLESFQELTTPVLLGGEGADTLTAENGTEDMLVDGTGSGGDILRANNYDDALINNEGKDTLEGGQGNDLLLSAVNCEGDSLDGAEFNEGDGADVNSSSWAKLPVSEGFQGVVANLESAAAGNSPGPACSAGETTKLLRIDDLEGSTGIDKLVGDGNGNNLLGRLSSDELLGQAGVDNIESAEDGKHDTVGGGTPTTSPGDTCRYDLGLDSLTGCESKNGV
jgi:Ca2+-binding RTX toxin-like protein